jgi:hypothetical protein
MGQFKKHLEETANDLSLKKHGTYIGCLSPTEQDKLYAEASEIINAEHQRFIEMYWNNKLGG